MNSIELVTKYSPIIDEYFVTGSKTIVLEADPKYLNLNFKEAGYVKIAERLLDGQSDYYKHNEGTGDAQHRAFNGSADGTRDGFGRAGATVRWKIYELKYLRGTRLEVDAISNEQAAGVVMAGLISDFIKYKVIPEVDEIRFSKMADAASASLGNMIVESGAIAANTILSKFHTGFEWLTEHEVPAEAQLIFVSPVTMTLIRNTSELSRYITQGEFRAPNGITFQVEKYFGRPIIEVPSSRFFTNVYVDPNNGYRPSSDSKLINFIICNAKAVLPIRKLEVVQEYGPEQAGLTGFYGYIHQFLMFHDCIIPDNKVTGVYVDVDNATTVSTKVDKLALDIRAGSVTNAWLLKNYFTNPAGMRGQIVFADTAFTLGATLTGTEGTDYFTIEKGKEHVDATATTHYFALVDDSKKIIAISGLVTLVKKS